MEKDEAGDALTLATLRRAAEALNCTLVYALAPNQPLDAMLKARAAAVAEAELKRTHHSMRLENQAVDRRDLQDERERLVAELLNG